MREILIRRVYRTGVQTVEREDGRFYVTLKNRTIDSRHEVPVGSAIRHYEALRDGR